MYEIVEGVFTLMPPAYFDGSAVLQRLIYLLNRHVDAHGLRGRFGIEVDLIVGRKRVACADAAFLTDDDLHRQKKELPARRADLENRASARRTDIGDRIHEHRPRRP